MAYSIDEKDKLRDTEQQWPVQLVKSNNDVDIEDIRLDALGLHSDIKRDMTGIEIIAVGWNICNSWAGVAATMALSIASGGTVTLIYGLIVVFFFGSATAASMAEIAATFPTSGGQYHWTSVLAPKRWSRILSFACGSVNVFAWIALGSGICIIPPQLLAGIVVFFDPSYVPKAWQIFLMYQAMNLSMLLYNITLLKRSMWVMNVGFVLSIAGFVAAFITSLARSHPKQPSDFVWTTFINSSGWKEDGLVFLMGLVNPNYMYSGLDGAVHLAEDCKNAAIAVPRALMATIVIGFVTSFAFCVAMTYSMQDFNSVLTTPTGVPIFELWYQATRSPVAATTFVMVVLVCGFFALAGTMQTASRLTYAFGRDNALIGSRFFAQVSPRFEVPVYALLFNSTVIAIIGFIYLGSTTAFNAFISTGLILQQVSIAFPVACLMARGRAKGILAGDSSFRLGLLGWPANIATVVFAVLCLVFYDFPVVMPVTAGNMNYASAVLGTMALFAVGNWFLHARKHYQGPRLD